KTRLFRLANTINNKSGLHKIELYPFEAMSLDIEEIKNKAKQPSERLEIETEYDVSESLKEVYHEPLNRAVTPSVEARKVNTKICMSKMMTGISEGERDQAGIRVAAHLKQSGLTDQMLLDRKSTRLNSSHVSISYAVFCLKKKKNMMKATTGRNMKSRM